MISNGFQSSLNILQHEEKSPKISKILHCYLIVIEKGQMSDREPRELMKFYF